MINDTFANGNSIIHRIDPQYRILFAAFFSSVIAVAKDIPTLILALVISAIILGIARLDYQLVAKRIIVVSGFVFLIWLVVPVTYESEHVFRLGPVPFYREGLRLSAQITLKSFAIYLAILALVSTISVTNMGYALNHLGLPNKMVFLLMMTYRYFSVIEQEYQRLSRAIKIRAFRPKTDIHTYRTYAYLIGMLFVRASNRAARVYNAMKCRGFKGTFYTLYEFPPHRRNTIFSAVMGCVILCIVILEWGIG